MIQYGTRDNYSEHRERLKKDSHSCILRCFTNRTQEKESTEKPPWTEPYHPMCWWHEKFYSLKWRPAAVLSLRRETGRGALIGVRGTYLQHHSIGMLIRCRALIVRTTQNLNLTVAAIKTQSWNQESITVTFHACAISCEWPKNARGIFIYLWIFIHAR